MEDNSVSNLFKNKEQYFFLFFHKTRLVETSQDLLKVDFLGGQNFSFNNFAQKSVYKKIT